MATTTTPSAIRTAVNDLIVDLDPAGADLGNAVYRLASRHFEEEDRPGADVDRQFCVGRIELLDHEDFGAHTEAIMSGRLSLWIGHSRGPDLDTGLGRREDDIEQIKTALSWPANRPDGVVSISFLGDGQQLDTEDGLGWMDELLFDMQWLGVPKHLPT
jgi:hypothetical protein